MHAGRIAAGTLLALALLTVPVAPASAQVVAPAQAGFSAERLQRIDQFVQRAMAQGEISGAVTLVARNGRIVHHSAQGVMDVASKQPMQKDTIFRFASMSKPMGAVALLMLVEEGKVRLDDPVSRYIPAYKDLMVAVPRAASPGPSVPGTPAYDTVPAARQITVLDLLTHTSGLMSGPNGNAAGSAAYNQRHELGVAWVEQLASTPLEFQPGTRWAYSAMAGFDVLARIVEISSGMNYRDFLQQRLFSPLGMRDIFFWPTAAQRARLVTLYTQSDKGLTPRADPDSMSGEKLFSASVGLMGTAEAYARFAMMLANGGEYNGVRVLSPASVRLMGSLVMPDSLPGRRPGEGFGLGVRYVSDPSALHSLLGKGSFGWYGAYGSHFWVDPEKKLVAVLMVQTPGQQRIVDFETAVMQAVID